MKSYMGILILSLAIVPTQAFSYRGEEWERANEHRFRKKFETEIVQWIGEVEEEVSSHANDHDLKFIMLDGEKYTIVDSPDIVNFRHKTNKKYLLEIEAEKTPRFLFWGGNLLIKKFKIIGENKEFSSKVEGSS